MSSQRILAIDDDRFFTRLVKAMAIKDGHHIDECNDASRMDPNALQNYDIILLDIMMPGMNGVDILSQIKTFAPRAGIVLMTSVEDGFATQVCDFARDIGVNLRGIMRKPFSRATLCDFLKRSSSDSSDALADDDTALMQKQAAAMHRDLIVKLRPQVLLSSNRWAGYDASLHIRNRPKPNRILTEIVHSNRGQAFSIQYDLISIKRALSAIDSGGERSLFHGSIAVYVSPDSISSAAFHDQLAAIMANQGIHKSQLTLEIPATCWDSGFQKFQEPLRRLHALGIRISAKGSPRELLVMIKADELLFDEVKIGELWTPRATTDHEMGKSIEKLLELAARRSIVSTADGVFDAKTFDFLVRRGCDIGQGPYFSEPMDIETLNHKLSESSSNEGASNSSTYHGTHK